MTFDLQALERRAEDFRRMNQNGDFNKVIDELTPKLPDLPTASELRKLLSTACSDRGTAHMQMGMLNQAIVDFQAAVHANPDNWRAFANLSTALKNNRQYVDAKAAIEAAISLNPQLNQHPAIQSQLSEIVAKLGTV